MKSRLYTLSLISLLFNACHKQADPVKPDSDAAAIMAGVYSLTFSSTSINQQINFGTPGSMTLVRVNPTALKATINMTGLPYLNQRMSDGTWTLTQQANDTISYSASAGYYGQYRSGEVYMSGYADGSLFFRFRKN